METEVIRTDDPGAYDHAFELLRAGGLVAFPTDTVYGLGALAFDEHAVRRIYTAKGRSHEKAIPILVADAAGLELVAGNITPMARRLAEHFWPGPLTLVVMKSPNLPKAVSSTDTVGVRVPNHPAAVRLLRLAGPMAVTSANASGESSPLTATDVLAQLNGRLQLILDGGAAPGGVPSTVVDCTESMPTILRAGPVTLEDIQEALS